MPQCLTTAYVLAYSSLAMSDEESVVGNHSITVTELIQPGSRNHPDLHEGYQSRQCCLCKLHSWALYTSKTVNVVSVVPLWQPFLPWARGQRQQPQGNLCLICCNVPNSEVDLLRDGFEWCCQLTSLPCSRLPPITVCRLEVFNTGGFASEHGGLKAFLMAVGRDPTKNHEFLSARKRWIVKKVTEPSVRIRSRDELRPQTSVSSASVRTEGLKGPKRQFALLEAFEREYKRKARPDEISYRTYKGKLEAGVRNSVNSFL